MKRYTVELTIDAESEEQVIKILRDRLDDKLDDNEIGGYSIQKVTENG